MNPDAPYIKYVPTITAEGREKLTEYVSDTAANVYAVHHAVPGYTAAQAFTRFAVGEADVRAALLLEVTSDTRSLAYGRDSFQQLVPLRMVVERVSALVTQLIEQARFASYIEPSVQVSPSNSVVIPEAVQGELRDEYVDIMARIAEIRSTITGRMTSQGADPGRVHEVARLLTPSGSYSGVVIVSSVHGFQSIITNLMASGLPEAHAIATQITNVIQQVEPKVPLSSPTTPQASKLEQFSRSILHAHEGEKRGAVRLVNVSPLDERSVAPSLLFASSSLSYTELTRQSESWGDATIKDIFDVYFAAHSGRALEEVSYTWEITCDYHTFRQLQRHRIVDAFEFQTLSPNLGYPMPEGIQDASQEGLYQDAFRRSEYLYNRLVQAGLSDEAQYAVLMGNRIRCRFVANARETKHIIELRTRYDDRTAAVCRDMHEQIKRFHPIIASHITVGGTS